MPVRLQSSKQNFVVLRASCSGYCFSCVSFVHTLLVQVWMTIVTKKPSVVIWTLLYRDMYTIDWRTMTCENLYLVGIQHDGEVSCCSLIRFDTCASGNAAGIWILVGNDHCLLNCLRYLRDC